MSELDINMLPWYEHQEQRWQWQRHWLYAGLIMLIGWCGCGHLWHGLWRSHYAEQVLTRLQSVQAQQPFSIKQQAQWLAAEQWRQHARTHQRQRLQDNHQLALIWQSLSQAGVTVQSIQWQPRHLQLTVVNPRQTDLEQVVRAISLSSLCQAFSASTIECQQKEDNSEVRP